MNVMSYGIIKRMLVIAGTCVFIVSAGAAQVHRKALLRKRRNPTVYREKDVTITATIQAIDLGQRIVTVQAARRGRWSN